jgi:PadR family transcriptional regulator, regulatory protein AphA
MDIKYAILGFLSWKALTGYDLKKLMINSTPYYWSGNNNQIYTALVELHKEGLVTSEVQHQERYPSRKIYTITAAGIEALKGWLVAPPELPQLRNSFLVQLAWSDRLDPGELDNLLAKYEDEVRMQLLMLKEQQRRGSMINPARTPREKYLWEMISENQVLFYENELSWASNLRRGVKEQ